MARAEAARSQSTGQDNGSEPLITNNAGGDGDGAAVDDDEALKMTMAEIRMTITMPAMMTTMLTETMMPITKRKHEQEQEQRSVTGTGTKEKNKMAPCVMTMMMTMMLAIVGGTMMSAKMTTMKMF